MAAAGDRDSRLKGAKLVSSNGTISGSFKGRDFDDLVRINVGERSSFNLTLTRIAKKNNVDVQLYRFIRPVQDVLKRIGKTDIRQIKAKDRNANYRLVAQSKKPSNKNENIAVDLDQGDYFIRFLRKQGTNTRYVATLTSTAISTPGPGQPGQQNRAPAAVNDSFTAEQGTAVTISTAQLLSNDTDPDNDLLTVTGSTNPANGTLVNNGNNTFTYTSNATFSGADSFTYTVSDGKGGTATGTVNLTVNPKGGGGGTENKPPVAGADSFKTKANTALLISAASLLSNDSDPDGNPITIKSNTNPANGTLVNNGNNTYTYTPKTGYSGGDSFNYTIADGKGGEATATVSLTVEPLPVINPGVKTSGTLTNSETEKRYTVNVAQGDFQFKLTGLSADADVQLLTQDGTVLNASTNAGTTIDQFIEPLAAGQYVLRVFRKPTVTVNTNFTVEFAKQTDAIGDTEAEAKDLGVLGSATVPPKYATTNYVVAEGKDSAADIYKFKLAADGNLAINVKGKTADGGSLFGDIDFELYAQGETPNPSSASKRTGNAAEELNGFLKKDTTYILKIAPKATTNGETNAGSTYLLDLAFTAGANKPNNIRNILAGDESSQASNFIDIQGLAYFSSRSVNENGEAKVSLWRSAGTLDKTSKVFDFAAGTVLSDFTNVNGQLYFVASDSANGAEIWTSDGSTNTKRVTDIVAGPGSSDPRELTAVGTDLYFYTNERLQNGNQLRKLWKVTQGVDTPQELTSTNFSPTDPTFGEFTAVGNSLYFTATNADGVKELWRVGAGNALEEMALTDGLFGSSPTNLTNVGGKLFLTANVRKGIATPGGNQELVRVDNFAAGAYNPANITVFNLDGDISGDPDNLLYVESTKTLYFSGTETATSTELYKLQFTTDTSEAATPAVVKDINADGGSNPSNLFNLNGKVIFFASDGTDNALWITDGTDANTRKVSSLTGLSGLSSLSSLEQFALVGNSLFFTASSDDIGKELRKVTFDPTGTSGTLTSYDLYKGTTGSNPDELTAVGTQLFFVANGKATDTSLETGSEPWSIPG